MHRLVLPPLVESLRLGVQEHAQRVNKPVLPIMTCNNREPLHIHLVHFDKAGVNLKGFEVFPAAEFGRVYQQPNSSAPIDHCVDLRPKLPEIGDGQFLRQTGRGWT
jgi:hypothetical protein